MKWKHLNSVYFTSDLFHALARFISGTHTHTHTMHESFAIRWIWSNFIYSPPVVISWVNRHTLTRFNITRFPLVENVIVKLWQSAYHQMSVLENEIFPQKISQINSVELTNGPSHYQNMESVQAKNQTNGCDFIVKFLHLFTLVPHFDENGLFTHFVSGMKPTVMLELALTKLVSIDDLFAYSRRSQIVVYAEFCSSLPSKYFILLLRTLDFLLVAMLLLLLLLLLLFSFNILFKNIQLRHRTFIWFGFSIQTLLFLYPKNHQKRQC